jgi:hypothetical protein
LPNQAAWTAAFSPAGPAPITIMSNESSMSGVLPQA